MTNIYVTAFSEHLKSLSKPYILITNPEPDSASIHMHTMSMVMSTGINMQSWGQKLVLCIHVCTCAMYMHTLRCNTEFGSLAGWKLEPWYNLSSIQQRQKQVGINKYFHRTVFFGKLGFVLIKKISFGQIKQSPKKSERKELVSVLIFFFLKN